MSTEKEISKWWEWFMVVGGVFALINFIRAFRKPPKEAYEQYEEIIREKDKIIADYEKKIQTYQELLSHDK